MGSGKDMKKGSGSMGIVRFAGFLTVFCLLEVFAAEADLTNVSAENLDGHVELSTLDLLQTTAPPTRSTPSSHPRKTLKFVIKRPIHQNSGSKINRSESTEKHLVEKKTNDDGQVLTDISKASFVANERVVIDEERKNDEDGGGISEGKGSMANESERGDKDFHHRVRDKDHFRKVLKQIKKRPVLTTPSFLDGTETENTTLLVGHVGKKQQRRKFLANRWYLKPKSSLNNPVTESEAASLIPRLSLISEGSNGSSANRSSKSLHDLSFSTTEIIQAEQTGSSTHVYPEQKDQDILFTQTGAEPDESLFEFTGTTEQDLFDIGNSEKENMEMHLKKVTVSLPRSFSEEVTEIVNDVTQTEATDISPAAEESMEYFDEDITTGSSSFPHKNNVNDPTRGYENVDFGPDTVEDITDIDIDNVPSESLPLDEDDGSASSPNITELPSTAAEEVKFEVSNGLKVEESATARFSSPSAPVAATSIIVSYETTAYEEFDTTTLESSTTPGATDRASNTVVDAEETVTSSNLEDNFSASTDLLQSSTFTFGAAEEQTDPSVTEEIVTVDPSHWYGINAEDGTIEVHPDTDKSENVTELFEDKQRTTEEDIAATEVPAEDTTIEDTTEKMVTVDPSHWYGIIEDDGVINEVPENVENTTKLVEENEIPVLPEEMNLKLGDRSDKALALDKETDQESSTISSSVYSTEVTASSVANYMTKSYKEDLSVTLTATVSDQTSLVEGGTRQASTTEQDMEMFDVEDTEFDNVIVEDTTVQGRVKSNMEDSPPSPSSEAGHIMKIERRFGGEHQGSTTVMSETTTSTEATASSEAENTTRRYEDDPETIQLNATIVRIPTTTVSSRTPFIECRTKVPSSTEQAMKTSAGETIEFSNVIVDSVEDTTVGVTKSNMEDPSPTTSRTTTPPEDPKAAVGVDFDTSSHRTANITEETVAMVPTEDNSSTLLGSAEEKLVTAQTVQSGSVTEQANLTATVDTEPTTGTDEAQNDTISSGTTRPNGKETETTAGFIYPPKEKFVPSQMELWINSDKHILNIVGSDEKEQGEDIVTDTKLVKTNGEAEKIISSSTDEGHVETEEVLFSNQSSTVEPMMLEVLNNTPVSIRYSASGDFYGNHSVYILRNILGKLANVSVQIKNEEDLEYIPSDVHVIEDLKHQLLNFTWKSSNTSFNKSLALVLNRTEDIYMISRIHLNNLKGGAILSTQRDIKNEPQIYKKPKQFNFTIDLSCDTKVTFSNLDFLRVKIETPEKDIQTGIQQSAEEREQKLVHMEIVIGVIIIVAILLVIFYLMVEKCRRKTRSKTIENDKSV